MNQATYDLVSANLLQLAHSIENAKRPGYTQGDVDVLRNFKESARRMRVTPMQAWGVFFNKHIDAINSFASDPNIPQAEDIVGRFADAINYLKLGIALKTELEKESLPKCGCQSSGEVRVAKDPDDFAEAVAQGNPEVYELVQELCSAHAELCEFYELREETASPIEQVFLERAKQDLKEHIAGVVAELQEHHGITIEFSRQ